MKPVTFGVSSLTLKDGRGFVQALNDEGMKLEIGKRLSIRIVAELIRALPDEERERIGAWEIDEASEVEAVPLDAVIPTMLPDSKVVNHVNNVTIWTLCILTLMLGGAVAYNIVVNHEYPKVTLGLVIVTPVTLCALWVIGVLRNRQSILSVVLGDGTAQESMGQSIVKAVAGNLINRR